MPDLTLLLPFLSCSAVGYMLYTRFRPQKQEQELEAPQELPELKELHFQKSCNILDDIASKRAKLEALENLLTNVELAHPQHLKAVKISTTDIQGIEISVDLLCGKPDEQTAYIKAVLSSQRAKLRAEITELLSILDRTNTVTQSETPSRPLRPPESR